MQIMKISTNVSYSIYANAYPRLSELKFLHDFAHFIESWNIL